MVLGNPRSAPGDAEEFYFKVKWRLGVFLKSFRVQSDTIALVQHFRLP